MIQSLSNKRYKFCWGLGAALYGPKTGLSVSGPGADCGTVPLGFKLNQMATNRSKLNSKSMPELSLTRNGPRDQNNILPVQDTEQYNDPDQKYADYRYNYEDDMGNNVGAQSVYQDQYAYQLRSDYTDAMYQYPAATYQEKPLPLISPQDQAQYYSQSTQPASFVNKAPMPNSYSKSHVPPSRRSSLVQGPGLSGYYEPYNAARTAPMQENSNQYREIVTPYGNSSYDQNDLKRAARFERDEIKNRYSSISQGSKLFPRRYCCGYFRNKRTFLQCCIPTAILFITGLAGLIYFLFPRIPEVDFGIPSGFQAIQVGTIQEFQSASKSKPFTANFTLDITIGVKSENSIDWKMDLVEASGYLIHPREFKSQRELKDRIAYGVAKNALIRANSKSNIFFVFTLSYSTTQRLTMQSIDDDVQMIALIDSCAPGTFGRPTYSGYPTGQITLKIKPAVTFLSFIRIDSLPSRVVSFPCPAQINQFFDFIKGS